MLSYTTSPGRMLSLKRNLFMVQKFLAVIYDIVILYCVFVKNLEQNTVKLGTKKNWPYKTGDLLKEVQLI